MDVGIITALAALVTALTSFFMILEMKKQRTANSKPIIKVLAINIKAIVNKNNFWSWGDSKPPFFPKLKIMNFGTGPALNIKVKWEVNIDSLVNVLKYFDPYNQINIKNNKGYLLEIDGAVHSVHNQQKESIDAIPINNDCSGLNVPTYYIGSFEKYVELGIINRPKEKNDDQTVGTIDLPDFPEIYVYLEYEEINGTKLKQQFKILPSFSSSYHRDIDKTDVYVLFNVEEVAT